jgi:hypothetical protein
MSFGYELRILRTKIVLRCIMAQFFSVSKSLQIRLDKYDDPGICNYAKVMDRAEK